MQLPLSIHQIKDDTFENFYAENSQLLLASLAQNFAEVIQPFFYVWGGESCGKSHLLKALSNHYLQQNRTASYLPLKQAESLSPAMLENIEGLDLICLDDLHAIAGNTPWETAIFNLFNQIRHQSLPILLLITANQPPNQLPIALPDLRSRLTWGEVYRLNDLTDEQKCHILRHNAHNKGLELPEEVANFLLKRLNRDLNLLLLKLDQLDKASLQAQRKLTVPFVKTILGL